MTSHHLDTDRGRSDDAAPQPTAVGVVDLESPTEIRFPVVPPRERHQRLRVLVRRQRRPLGFVEIAAPGGAWSSDALEQAIEGLAGPRAGWPTELSPPPALEPITVVVCTRDREDMLRRSLQAILAQADDETEIVLVDNAPRTDGTRRVADELADPRITYVLEPRPGLSVARNTGMSQARHQLVAFTDDDVVADPDWLAMLSEAFRGGDAGCITGSVPTAELETDVQHYFERRFDWSGSMDPVLYRKQDQRPGVYPFSPGIFGTGANFALTKQTYDTVGPFDERLGAGRRTRGGEDLDYFFRVVWAGIGLRQEPAAMVWHIHRNDEANYRDQVLGYGVGFGAFATKLLLNPRWAAPFVARIPRGVLLLRRAMSTAEHDNGLPPEFLALERRGMVLGPVAFGREWRTQRKSGRW